MKNKTLAIQIWIMFAAFMFGLSLLIVLLVPFVLRPFFIQDTYTRIEDAQNMLRTRLLDEFPPIQGKEPRNIGLVRHIILLENQAIMLPPSSPPVLFLQEAKQEALGQTEASKRYVRTVQNKTVYYVIRKGEIDGQDGYLLSYVWEDYYNRLVASLYRQLVGITGFILIISFPFSFWLANYLARPLIHIEKHVKRIADRDWHEPLLLDRKDEIGRLAQSVERMRKRLVRQDETQRSLLQHVSHELKTPVMVIRSYTQAIQDGIYPKGDLPGTIHVIEEESERLEKQIHDLLYLTKLDYLSTQELVPHPVNIERLLHEVADRLRWRRPEVNWVIHLSPLEVEGDKEQLRTALENLLDNQIRYAATQIVISAREEEIQDTHHLLLRIWNDGGSIAQEDMEGIFEPFHKGKKGQFGLGLAIVKRIAALHRASVYARNEEGGVAFYLKIPFTKKNPS